MKQVVNITINIANVKSEIFESVCFFNDSSILPELNVNYNCVPSHNYSTHLDVLGVDHIKIHNFERKCSLIIFFFLDIQLFFRWRITAVLANKKLWRVLCETFLKISFIKDLLYHLLSSASRLPLPNVCYRNLYLDLP